MNEASLKFETVLYTQFSQVTTGKSGNSFT
jgi:hypothetical protein